MKSQSYIVAYWSQDEAFADAVDYTMTMHELAADLIDNDLDVPRTTLIDRLKGRVNLDSKFGRPQALTEEEEATLVKYISYMAQHRHPVTREQIVGLAWACPEEWQRVLY